MIDKHDALKTNPFSYREGKEKVFIYFNGKEIMVLKGKHADKLLRKIEGVDEFNEQLALAKITGHFKH